MSKYANRAIMSLLNMCNEVFRKNIEIRRITKTCALLLLSGLSPNDIPKKIIDTCLSSQKDDGGFIGNTDTLWNIKFLEFYPQYEKERNRAIAWLVSDNGDEEGFGRSKRDMHRIPVTGLALYLLPEIATEKNLEWLEKAWSSELNSLTYKAAYSILAFNQNNYKPKTNDKLIHETAAWLSKQQEVSGGFAPWLNHPVGENVYCTAVALIALITMQDDAYRETIKRGYDYLCRTQLKSGIWAYHEIEDGASWGLFALSQAEKYLEEEAMNVLVIYPKPDKDKKPRFGFSYEMLLISTVLAKYHNVRIKDYSCEPFDECELIEYVRREDIDIALVECDSYALKRSQNILHAAEIIDVLNQYTHTIAYGNYCYITKKVFGNAMQTVTDNEINNIIDFVNQYDKYSAIPHVEAYDELPYIDRNMLMSIPYYKYNDRNTLLQTSKGCENTCIF